MPDPIVRSIDMLTQVRALIARSVDGLSAEQLNMIPDGHKNNILWNLGHIVVVQQLLHYKLSSLPLYVSDGLVAAAKTGTSPADWSSPPDVAQLKTLITDLPVKLADDYSADRFATFEDYTTSTGVTLRTLDEALAFNHYHEGVHTGVILALKKRAQRA